MTQWHAIESKAEWDDTLATFSGPSLQQSWQWGEVNVALGHDVARYSYSESPTTHAAMQVIVKSAKRGRYLEVPSGPLLDWNDQEMVSNALDKLRMLAREKQCVFVRFRPQLPDQHRYRELLSSEGAKPALMHISADHTSIVDLSSTNEELLTAMRQQTRYEVRRAAKRGIVVEESTNQATIDTFYQLQADTAKRQGFIAPSKDYLQACLDSFGPDAHIYTATKNDQLLNAAIILWFGNEAAYFEAASTPEARREPGAYAIVWHAMQNAKAAGKQYFNLWGTAPPNADKHRYAGVTTFKRGFGGEDVAYVPAHDLSIKPVLYNLTRAFEFARKKRRHL